MLLHKTRPGSTLAYLERLTVKSTPAKTRPQITETDQKNGYQSISLTNTISKDK